MRNSQRFAIFSAALVLVFVAGAPMSEAATSTSFSPSTVPIAPGGSATITISTVGVSYSPPPTAIMARYTLNIPAGYTVSNVACIGTFAGANPTPNPIVGGFVGCGLDWAFPGVSAASGDVLTFTLTRGASAGLGTLTMNAPASDYVRSNESLEPVGTTNSVAAADVTIVPALGRYGLAGLALLLGFVGVLVFRRGI